MNSTVEAQNSLVAVGEHTLTPVDRLIFSCEGREHLLDGTMQSFAAACPYRFHRTILAIDGQLNPGVVTGIRPDRLVQNPQRQGYIHNILNALSLVESEYFFWLEDDWQFATSVELDSLIALLEAHPDWVQIRLSKTAPLTPEEQQTELVPGMFESYHGFSANPCLCRTAAVQAAFAALLHNPRSQDVGFEEFLGEWFRQNHWICAVRDPGTTPEVGHTGYLESTPRQWHMTASLDGQVQEYVSGMRHVAFPSFAQRLWMAAKLIKTCCQVAVCLFWRRADYDLAFRITVTKGQ